MLINIFSNLLQATYSIPKKKYLIKIYFSFLDEAGNLCQDKLETIQDTEYETMIQCRVAMKKTCSNQKNSADNNANQQQTQPNEACHTVYDKNCKTVYRPHRSKVRKLFAKNYEK